MSSPQALDVFTWVRRHSRLGVLAVALVAALGGCTTSSGGDAGFVSGDGSITQVDASDREPAPTLEGETLADKPISTEDFAGKTLVVNTWGSWCGPCRSEAPELVKAAKRLEDDDVQFVGLATKSQTGESTPAQDIEFADSAGMTYPSIQDYDGEQQLGFVDSLPANAIPTTWIIDDEGRVAARILGETTASTLSGLVEDIRADA